MKAWLGSLQSASTFQLEIGTLNLVLACQVYESVSFTMGSIVLVSPNIPFLVEGY